MNASKLKLLKTAVFMSLGLALYVPEVYAMNSTEIAEPMITFIQEKLLNNVGTVGVLSATVIGLVMTLGQKVTQFALNLIGYVCVAAFGGTAAITALTAAGYII